MAQLTWITLPLLVVMMLRFPGGNLGEETNSTQNPRQAPNSTAPNSTAPNSTAPNPTAPNPTAPNPKLQLRNVSVAIFTGLGVGALVILAVVFINWKKTKGNETQNTNNTTDLEEKVSYASIRFNKNPKVQFQIQSEGDNASTGIYSNVGISSSAAEASTDQSNLYATIRKP